MKDFDISKAEMINPEEIKILIEWYSDGKEVIVGSEKWDSVEPILKKIGIDVDEKIIKTTAVLGAGGAVVGGAVGAATLGCTTWTIAICSGIGALIFGGLYLGYKGIQAIWEEDKTENSELKKETVTVISSQDIKKLKEILLKIQDRSIEDLKKECEETKKLLRNSKAEEIKLLKKIEKIEEKHAKQLSQYKKKLDKQQIENEEAKVKQRQEFDTEVKEQVEKAVNLIEEKFNSILQPLEEKNKELQKENIQIREELKITNAKLEESNRNQEESSRKQEESNQNLQKLTSLLERAMEKNPKIFDNGDAPAQTIGS